MEEEEEEEDFCKVVLLGEAGVGKTSIISRFINGTFEERLMSTNGAAYVNKNMELPEYENKIIKFEIWDTAGQEQYRSLNKIFYKDAAICILVYDITNLKSFNSLIDYWYKEILDTAPKNTIIGLAANKSDLDDKEIVQEEIAREFAKQINAIFMYTSACKSFGIDELFHFLGCKYIDPTFKVDDKKLNDVKNSFKQNSQIEYNKKDKTVKLNEKKHTKKEHKKKKCC
jgi:small GTP-binding protein